MSYPKVTYKTFTRLSEGVHNGFTFALLDDENTTMHTEAQCKDYFQDLWWSENRQQPTEVWGFEWKPGRIKLDAECYRFALKFKDVLRDRMDNLLNFLHIFEQALGYRPCSIEQTIDENVLIITVSSQWFISAPMISAWTTLVRLSLQYAGGDVMEYLDNVAAPVKRYLAESYRMGGENKNMPCHEAMLADLGRYDKIRPRIKALLKGQEARLDWAKLSGGYVAHESGICGHKGFPEVK